MSDKTKALPALPLTLCELTDPGVPGMESYSPFCLKVHRALRSAGLPYVRRHAENPAAFKAHHPRGQVPVLLVGDEAVADSTRILARIETLGGRSLLAGLDAGQRAEALLWEELADTSLNGFVVAARWADDRNWPGVKGAYFASMPGIVRAIVPGRLRAGVLRRLVARDVWADGADACWRRFEETLDLLDARAPRTGFWLGESPSVADVSLFGQLHGLRLPLTAWQGEQVGARSRLTAWLDRVDQATGAAGVELPRAARAKVPAVGAEQRAAG